MQLTPAIKNILIINVLIYLFQLLGGVSGLERVIYSWFALSFSNVFSEFHVWSLLTYAFLHGSFMHILFNMLIFFFIGSELERMWGTRKFLQFYLWNCFGAGLCIFTYAAVRVFLFGDIMASQELTIGASGGIFALLFAYSVLFAERQITLLLFFVIPVTIRAKYLVWASLAITFLAGSFSSASISHIGHIGGVVSAILFFLIRRRDEDFYQAAVEQKLLFSNFFSTFRSNRSRIRRTYSPFSRNKKRQGLDDLDETHMNDREIERRIDELLDVISTRGLKHLTPEERAFLNRVSLLYRHKFPQ